MADTTLQTAASTANDQVRRLEDAYADFAVADSLLCAVDKFFDEVRAWAAPGGVVHNEHLLQEVQHGSTVLDKARDMIADGKRNLSEGIDFAVTARGQARG